MENQSPNLSQLPGPENSDLSNKQLPPLTLKVNLLIIISLVLFLITILSVSVLAYIFIKPKLVTQTLIPTNTQQSEAALFQTGTIVPSPSLDMQVETENQDFYPYSAKINWKIDDYYRFEKQRLAEVMGVGEIFDYSVTSELISENPYQANTIYYFNLKSNIKSGKYYNDEVDLEITSLPRNISAYLADHKYCEIDADCQIRQYICGHGVYNQFSPVMHGGCGELNYDGVTGSPDCPFPMAEYDTPKCVENVCQASVKRRICPQE